MAVAPEADAKEGMFWHLSGGILSVVVERKERTKWGFEEQLDHLVGRSVGAHRESVGVG